MQIFYHLNIQRFKLPRRNYLRRYHTRLLWLFSLSLLIIALPSLPAQATQIPSAGSQPMLSELGPPYPPSDDPPPPSLQAAQGTLETFKTTADADIREGAPAQNFGLEPTMSAGYDNYGAGPNGLKQRALLRFGISRYLPPGVIIHSARLLLPMVGSCDAVGATKPFWFDRIDGDWAEMAANWNNQPPVAEAYGPYEIGTMPPGSTKETWYTFDVADLVRAWVSGAHPEYGLMIRGLEPSQLSCGYRTFLTKGGGGYQTAPQLEIDYTLPAPALSVSEQNIVITRPCVAGAAPAEPRDIDIQTNTDTLSDWSADIVGDASWLTLNKIGGKVSRIFPSRIALAVSAAAPCPATLNAQIQISASGIAESKTISVTFKHVINFVYLPTIIKAGGNAGARVAAAPATFQRIALVVGVADYQYLPNPPAFSAFRPGRWGYRLLATRSDGIAMEQRFTDSGDSSPPGMAVLSADRPSKTISLIDRQATLANIVYALEWIDDHEDADTEVLIYFSGHGGPTPDESPFDEDEQPPYDELLGAYDTNTDANGFVNHLIDDNLNTLLANLETQHLAVIFDACNSGGMEVGNLKRAVLAAAREDQVSWETSEFEHGVFTYFMLKAMDNPACDTNQDGWLSVQEIYNCANQNVTSYVQANMSTEQNLALDVTSDVRVVRMGK